ncbi:Ribonuclease HII [Pandoraea eparura]|jgi:ribonuclease HII|uniref:Ribonuclease HII n=2 Tax=Pandoraea eparura TaxID=2508291 RepID=A0A5E4WLL4_9BURK|nr:Ribonuclease HII [Pandoraea eparura]
MIEDMKGRRGARKTASGDLLPSEPARPEKTPVVQSASKSAMKPRTRTPKATLPQMALDLFADVATDLTCGVDEVGRGPLAGPVVTAAVILDPARPIKGLADSKKLTAQRREALYEEIVERSLAYCIAEASVAEIDSLNILHATMLAMQRAVNGLSRVPTLALIDGNRCPMLPMRAEAIIKGDDKVPAISAASILAKVTRDRQLVALHEAFPQYGFDEHVGYGTPRHLAALRLHGPSPHHRQSFAPVREAFALFGAITVARVGHLS